MIEASFDRSSRMAAVGGVYQYDTGQRLRMNGLPLPDEFLAEDDLIDGEVVTVQAQFGYEGDEQADTRLAQWDDERWCWLVEIPDAYLTRIDPVHVYVYVYHGEKGDASRARTMYECVFSPISRPAPNNIASGDMFERWETLEVEVDLVLASASTSIANATTHAASANAAAQEMREATKEAQAAAGEASTATDRLEKIEQALDRLTVKLVNLSSQSNAYVQLSEDTLTYGIPRGENGAKGATGDTGPADIGLSISGGVLTITPK